MAHLLVNPVSPVWFSGWKTDTLTLSSNGWDVSVKEDFERRRFEMLLYHAESDIKMLAQSRVDPMRERHSRFYEIKFGYDGPEFFVNKAWQGRALIHVVEVPSFDDWNDTRPTMMHCDERDVMSLPIFQKRSTPVAEQLIVEPQDVMQLLDQIKRMQAPEQADIRKRNRQAAPLAHATILSFERKTA